MSMPVESAGRVGRHCFGGPSPHTPHGAGSLRCGLGALVLDQRFDLRSWCSGVVANWVTYWAHVCVLVMPREALNVKKLLALAAVAGGVFLVLRRKSAAKAEADLWREATAPAGDAKK